MMNSSGKSIFGLLTVIVVAGFIAGCGRGGTETGSSTSSPADILTYATNIEVVASALVPEVDSSEAAAARLSKAINYSTSADWDYYVQSTKIDTLANIFGDPDDLPITETKIRYLVREFSTTVEATLTNDPTISCDGATTFEGGDTVEIAFYGAIENGSEGDRYFSCLVDDPDPSANYDVTTLYGREENGTLHFVYMNENTSPSNNPNVNYDYAMGKDVFHAKYYEVAEDGGSRGYLDLQYAKLVIYDGDDEEFLTNDDVVFKMRSRITGYAGLDADGNATLGYGDFAVTKYDRVEDDPGEFEVYLTMSTGRGSYANGEYSIFALDTTSNPDVEGEQFFCLQNQGDALPAYADSGNCEGYENAFAWASDITFPFDIDPELTSSFEDKPFFEDNDTDMIANDGSNFEIPDYL